jgi:hypothetical protein
VKSVKQKPVKMRNETDLLSACLKTLEANGVMCWRQNSGAARYESEAGDSYYVSMTGKMRGVSDIIGLLPGGRFLAVECKWMDGRIKKHQQEFLDAVNRSGGLGVVVRSIAELREKVLIHARTASDVAGGSKSEIARESGNEAQRPRACDAN